MRGTRSKRNPSLTRRVTMNRARVTFFVGRAITGLRALERLPHEPVIGGHNVQRAGPARHGAR